MARFPGSSLSEVALCGAGRAHSTTAKSVPIH